MGWVEVNPLFLLLFFIAWAAMMGSYFYFALHVAPSALRRWAEEQGYQIVKKRIAGPLDWWSFAKFSGHQIYRNGALGLNRYFGRVPRPGARGETQVFMAQVLGLVALCLAAMVTLRPPGSG
jgi:hypothetical protein